MNATITVPADERLLDLFAPEDLTLSRASYTIKQQGDHVVFAVQAEDAVALRTALSAITKLLSLWERSERIP